MRHAIKCKVCDKVDLVNGQKQISQFVGEHKHDNQIAGMTGENVEIDNSQDRIDLRIDPPPLYTGGYSKPVRDYWRKIPGGI